MRVTMEPKRTVHGLTRQGRAIMQFQTRPFALAWGSRECGARHHQPRSWRHVASGATRRHCQQRAEYGAGWCVLCGCHVGHRWLARGFLRSCIPSPLRGRRGTGANTRTVPPLSNIAMDSALAERDCVFLIDLIGILTKIVACIFVDAFISPRICVTRCWLWVFLLNFFSTFLFNCNCTGLFNDLHLAMCYLEQNRLRYLPSRFDPKYEEVLKSTALDLLYQPMRVTDSASINYCRKSPLLFVNSLFQRTTRRISFPCLNQVNFKILISWKFSKKTGLRNWQFEFTFLKIDTTVEALGPVVLFEALPSMLLFTPACVG